MSTNREEPLTLSREDLYELAWSKQMSELAKDFGISNVALAKRCRRLHIPVPGRGYWARVAARQSPPRERLPKRQSDYRDITALTIPAPVQAPHLDAVCEKDGVSDTASDSSLNDLIAACPIAPSLSILNALGAVKRTGYRLKHPRRSEFTFNRGEKDGAIIDIEVSSAVLDRALLFADTLLRAAASLDWTFVVRLPRQDWPSPAGHRDTEQIRGVEARAGQLLVSQERISFRIEERIREEPRIPTAAELAREKREYGYHAERKLFIATGALRVVRMDEQSVYCGPNRRSWYDHRERRIESQIHAILAGFYELALQLKARRAEQERRRRERDEQERRRIELEARQEAFGKLIKQLEIDAGAWYRARMLRRYVRAARATLSTGSLRAPFLTGTIDFLERAEQYIGGLDPLCATARSPDFTQTRSGYHRGDSDRTTGSLLRLIGDDWEAASKLQQRVPIDSRT